MKVSIITATYNCGKYLMDCINSVRQQTYPYFEHVILNDRSTDGTRALLDKESAKDSRLKIISSHIRMKCGSAYKSLSHSVGGDIVIVLDADDALCASSVKSIVSAYEKYPSVDYVWTQFWLCDQRLRKLRKGFSCPPVRASLLESGLSGKHCFSHARTFRAKLLTRGEIFPEGITAAVDKHMGYSLEELGYGGFLNIPLYKYRQRIGGLSFTGRKIWKKMLIEFSEKRKANNITPYKIEVLTL